MGSRLFIDGVSALRFWRWRRTACPSLHIQTTRIRTLRDCASTGEEIGEALRGFIVSAEALASRASDNEGRQLDAANVFGNRLHVLVAEKAARCQASNVVSRIMSSDPVVGSFSQIADNVFVLSPEATFEQVAQDLSVPKRVLLGMEFCGSYAPSTQTGEHVFELAPLTRVKELAKYCEGLPHSKGSKTADLLNCLRWVVDDSASLMESVVVVLLVLPYKYGGYGVKVPLMNIGLDDAGNLVPPKTKGCMMPDVVWPRDRVSLEYNGKGSHFTQGDYEHDSDRKERLERLGYRVIPVSGKKVYDAEAFHKLALEVAWRTGKRLCLPELFEKHRSALRADVLPRRRTATHRQGGSFCHSA